MIWTTWGFELKALDAKNNLGLWITWMTMDHELKALDTDSTHGSLALKVYQQNLYLKYYY